MRNLYLFLMSLVLLGSLVLGGTGVAQATTFTLLPVAAYSGTVTSQTANVAAGTYNAQYTVSTTNFTDPATAIDVQVQYSTDNGKTWQINSEFKATGQASWGGGRGQPAATTDPVFTEYVTATFPQTTRVRMVIIVTGTVTFGVTASLV